VLVCHVCKGTPRPFTQTPSDPILRARGEPFGRRPGVPPSDGARSKLKLKKFFDFCLHQEGKPYDTPQAIKSAVDVFDKSALLGGVTYNIEDFSKFFCSELVAAALEAAGVIKKINASEVTPIDLCMFTLYAKDYYQLKGPRRTIHGINTIDPTGFGR
jgi:hypothetical protein